MEIMNEYGQYFIYGSAEYDAKHPDNPKNIKGCIKNGVSEEKAKFIWDKMVKFASYAFNKSHATCYAAIGAKTAWLSCYYPVEFMAGVLNSYVGKNDKLSRYVRSCKQRNIEILNPDINKSNVYFSVILNNDKSQKYKKSILFGLSGIKGVGNIAAHKIVEERNKNGDFKDIIDFLERMARHQLDKATLEALIYTGAFDCFNITKADLINQYDNMLGILANIKKHDPNQLTLFSLLNVPQYKIEYKNLPELNYKIISAKELEYLGCFIKHPVDNFKDTLNKWRESGNLNLISELDNIQNYGKVRLSGFVMEKEFKEKYNNKTKKNSYVLKFTLSDTTGEIDCIAFGKDAIKFNDLIQSQSVIYLLGVKNDNDFGLSINVKKAVSL